MKKLKLILLILVIILNVLLAAGCWNYREIEKMAIVAGAAVDKGTEKKFLLTTEIIQVSGGKESKTTSSLLSAEGDTIFEAARNMISFTGRRLYWSHSKVIIISEELARKGCVDIIDWFSRDAETRSDIKLLVARNSSAKSILEGKTALEVVHSFELNEMLTSEKSLGKAPDIDLWDFSNDLASNSSSPITPSVAISNGNNKGSAIILGTAIFKKDKLIGYLNGEETQDLLIIRNKFKRGVFVYKEQDKAHVSLEVFKSRTKVKPVVNGSNIEMMLSTYSDTAIDEIEDNKDYIEDEGRNMLEKDMGKLLEMRIKKLIEKVQTQYKVDIFGFGEKLHEDDPKVWKQVGKDWNEGFQSLNVNIDIKIHIRNSAMLSKKLSVGE